MGRGSTRAFGLAGVLALLVAFALLLVGSAGARVTPGPTVDIQSVGSLAPDGGSISLEVLASCPERWTVAEAVVTVSQPQASGSASFPLTCIGSVRPFRLTVVADNGTFALGQAQASARVVVKRGKTVSAQDAETLQVDPTVAVELDASGRIQSGGGSVLLGVTVACNAGLTGRLSGLNVSQSGITSGNGSYTPVCDGTPHRFEVTVTASQGTYQPGIAQALTFANADFNGNAIYGVDDDGALELET